MRLAAVLALLTGAALVATFASAAPPRTPDINVDFGTGTGIPSDTHAGPANQPGHWNVVSGLEPEPIALFATDGAATGVTISFSLPFGPAAHDNPATFGDSAALLDDYLDLHSVPSTMEIHGLPKGSYVITTLAWAPDSPAYRTSVSNDGRQALLVGGEWPGTYREGVTHASHRVHVRAGDVAIIRLFGIGKGTLNGVQISGH